MALPGRGQSGGARVIYYYRATRGRVYLLLAYTKNVRGSVIQAETSAMKQLVTRLEEET